MGFMYSSDHPDLFPQAQGKPESKSKGADSSSEKSPSLPIEREVVSLFDSPKPLRLNPLDTNPYSSIDFFSPFQDNIKLPELPIVPSLKELQGQPGQAADQQPKQPFRFKPTDPKDPYSLDFFEPSVRPDAQVKPGGDSKVPQGPGSSQFDMTFDVPGGAPVDKAKPGTDAPVGPTGVGPKGPGSDGSTISRNAENPERIESVEYPGGKKRRNFGYDGNQLASIETIEKRADGTEDKKVFAKDKSTNSWYVKVDGLKATLPGNIELRPDGSVAFQLDNQGRWQTERPDGTTAIERTNLSGARLGFSEEDQKAVKHVTRPDNSSVECSYEGGSLSTIKETAKDGTAVTWAAAADNKWISDENPPRERKNMAVQENGNVVYEDTAGKQHIVRGNGKELVQDPAKPSFEFDNEGRLKSIIDAKTGFKFQDLQFDDNGKLQSLNINDPKRGVVSYKRTGAEEWSVTDAQGRKVNSGVWRGDVNITEAGEYSYKEVGGDGFWHTYKHDGTRILEKKNADGSHQLHDAAGNLQVLTRPNGTKVEASYDNGVMSKVVESNAATGEKTTWSFNAADKTWSSDAPNSVPNAKAPIDKDGVLKFKAADGATYQTKTDGSTDVVTEEGVKVEIDAKGFVRKTTAKSGDSRTFDYEDGKLKSVTDVSKAGGTNKWSADNMAVSKLGDITFTTPEGLKGASRADFSKVEYNRNGDVAKVTLPNGLSRTMVYDGDTHNVKSIIDTRKGPSGEEKSKTWERQKAPDGTWTDSYAYVRQDGKFDARHHVKMDEFGRYTYRDAKGDQVSRVGDRLRGDGENYVSESVADAHDNLLETMTPLLGGDEKRAGRFAQMMKRFEQRMQDRIEARTAGGEDLGKVSEDTEKTVAACYDQLSQMCSAEQAPGQVYDQATRAKLVENFMFHAQDTTTIDQGGNGTCWIQAGHINGMISHPDSMARLLKEVSCTGTFTTLNDGTAGSQPRQFRFSQGLLGIRRGSEESNWTIDRAYEGGRRSPVSMIFDQTLPVIGGRREWRSNAGNYGGSDGARRIMMMVTGDTVCDSSNLVGRSERQTLLSKGGFITYAPGHMRTRQLVKQDGEWYVVQDDQHGEHSDHRMTKIRDLKQWLQERPGRRDPRNPFGPGGDNPIQPGPDGPYGPDQPYEPQPRPFRPMIRRIFRRF